MDASPALQYFLDTVIRLERTNAESIQLLTDKNKASGLGINSLVFQVVTENSTSQDNNYVLAILADQDRVNVTALEQAVLSCIIEKGEATIQLASSERVQSLCGFVPGTIPPIGLKNHPLVTVVEQQLLQQEHLIGGGGQLGQSCRLTVETLLQQQSNSTILVASFREIPNTRVQLGKTTGQERQEAPKPFFAVEPPDTSIAETVINNNNDTLLQPTWVSVVGRISGVRRMARRLVFCDLAPPLSCQADDEHPWRSGLTGQDMAVQLIAGKTLCQRHDEDALRRLKVGQLVWIQGKTNVKSRDSLRNWIDKRSLDIVVFDYQILHHQDDGSTNIVNSPLVVPKHSRSVLGIKHTPKHETPGMSYLRLNEVYGEPDEDRGSHVTIVDTLQAVSDFANDLTQTVLSLTKCEDDNFQAGLVGIDCEWKPNFLQATSNEPQPVLLLQICIHSLKNVYLLDLQTLLRPLLLPAERMNDVEAAVSEALASLLMSKRLIKVGFQLVQDLRRLAASYPHVPCFQVVHGVLETSSLGKKVMHMAKQRHSRDATSSLSRMAEHFVGRTLNKEEQCSDWSLRPLSEEQIEYAALDAVVTPVIVERLLQSVDARFFDKPQLGRWKNDVSFSKSLTSWRFLFLKTADVKAIRKLNAKRIIGNPFIVTQNWITGEDAPRLPSVPPNDSDGPYTDRDGIVRVPSHMVAIDDELKSDIIDVMVGERLGKSKDRCVAMFLKGSASLPEGAKLDFPQRSGYVEFQNAVVLFVNMPSKPRGQPRSYPNEWLEDGQILTWFLRAHDWKQGTTSLAQKMSPSENGDLPTVVLFVRMGKGHFLCCGRCRVAPVEDITSRDSSSTTKQQEWNLVRLHLLLLDWSKLYVCGDFQELVNPTKGLSEDHCYVASEEDSSSSSLSS